MGKFIDLTGKKYGNLTVLELYKRENGKIHWLCRCNCGNIVTVAGSNLKNGHTKSCGCAKNESPSNLTDLSGKRFGKLQVLKKGNGRITHGGQYKVTWICKCDCGNYAEIDGEKIKSGHTTSCGCKKKEIRSNFADLTGKKFGRLTVIRFLEQDQREARQYNWLCKCDCGKEIKANAFKLKNGLQQSCGCLKREMQPRIGEITKKYRYSNKRLYSVYKGMIDRCYNEKNNRYKDYGKRGIEVCGEWKKNYDSFAEWAYANGYDENAEHGECTIERKDVNGNYCPENCCWIANNEQQNNRRDCVFLEYKGEIHTISEWASELQMPYRKIYYYCRTKKLKIDEMLEKLNMHD